MKCVGYDNNFQRELSEKYSVWVPPPPKPKRQKNKLPTKGKGGVTGKTKSGPRMKPRGKKPKVEETSEDGREFKSESDDDLEYVDLPATRLVKRKREAPETKFCSGNESDGGSEYVDTQPTSHSRKRTRVDIMDGAMKNESDTDLEYVDHPISLPPKKRSATPDAVPDIGSGSDDDLEYVDSPVVLSPDEVISIADKDEMFARYKLQEGTYESPICL